MTEESLQKKVMDKIEAAKKLLNEMIEKSGLVGYFGGFLNFFTEKSKSLFEKKGTSNQEEGVQLLSQKSDDEAKPAEESTGFNISKMYEETLNFAQKGYTAISTYISKLRNQ